MRILIVTNHFWPENFRINDLAVGLKERGHEVTVYSGIPDYPGGRYYRGYGIIKRRVDDYRGVRVVHFPLVPRGKGRGWNLLLNYLSSCAMASLLAPVYCRGSYDVIFVFDTSPVTIGIPAVVMRWLKSIPMVFWVLDLWPESLSATGAVRSPRVLSAVNRVVRFIYRRCDRLLVSSRGFVKNIETIGGYTREIEYFPNWAEPGYLGGNGPEQATLPDLPGGFRLMFAGNIGAAQDFETILHAAETLKGQEIHWVVIGDGRRFEWVKGEIDRRGLDGKFHLLGRFPAEMMPAFFAQADVMLLTLKREPIFALTVPGKLQSYMASGKPIVAGIDGEGAALVEEAGCGLTCPAESPDRLAACVKDLYEMPRARREKMGENALQYARAHFDREALFDRLEELFSQVVQAGRSH